MKIRIGQQYPGKQKALELMEKYRLSGDYKSGVIDLLNKRAWKGLTGTLFHYPLFMDIIQMDRKIFNEYKKLKSYQEYLNFKNKYKDFIFIDYYKELLLDNGKYIDVIV